MNVARIYLRVSTEEQDLTRQAEIELSTRAAGYYIAGVYRDKASGARADRPELLRMIADLQPGEVRRHEFLVPGTYTVSGGTVTIDGVDHGAGSRVTIARGVHALRGGTEASRLLWGDGIVAPATAWTDDAIYVGF